MSSDRPRRGRGVPVSWGRSQRLSRDDLRRPGRSLETSKFRNHLYSTIRTYV